MQPEHEETAAGVMLAIHTSAQLHATYPDAAAEVSPEGQGQRYRKTIDSWGAPQDGSGLEVSYPEWLFLIVRTYTRLETEC
jgi:hypothetical protein